MDALIEGADFWCAIMRAECDPLFGRALRAGRLELTQLAHEETQVSTKPELAPVGGNQETLVEQCVKTTRDAHRRGSNAGGQARSGIAERRCPNDGRRRERLGDIVAL